MATLRELLDEHLPHVLDKDPEKARSGTEIIAALIARYPDFGTQYAETSLRQYFSGMAKDPTSCIARVEAGYGYYLREVAAAPPANVAADEAEEPGGRDKQSEEKFRSIFLRWAEVEDRAVCGMPIEHTKGTKATAGTNLWKYPDVVLVRWLLDIDTTTGKPSFDPHSLKLRTSLGERLFRLNSVELKVAVTIGDARAKFFQCVSNSRWAHTASLVIAEAITDEKVAAELRRLGTSYGVEVKTFGLAVGVLAKLPDASKISEMFDADFAKQVADPFIRPTILTPGEDRPELDWSYLADIRPQNPDFNQLLGWVAFCIGNSQPYRHGAYVATL